MLCSDSAQYFHAIFRAQSEREKNVSRRIGAILHTIHSLFLSMLSNANYYVKLDKTHSHCDVMASYRDTRTEKRKEFGLKSEIPTPKWEHEGRTSDTKKRNPKQKVFLIVCKKVAISLSFLFCSQLDERRREPGRVSV